MATPTPHETSLTKWHEYIAVRPRVLTSGAHIGERHTGRIARRKHKRTGEWRYALRHEVLNLPNPGQLTREGEIELRKAGCPLFEPLE